MISILVFSQFIKTMQNTNRNIDSITIEALLPSKKYANSARDKISVKRMFSDILLHFN